MVGCLQPWVRVLLQLGTTHSISLSWSCLNSVNCFLFLSKYASGFAFSLMLLPSVRSKGKRLKLIEHVPDTVYYVLPSLFLPLYGDASYILPNMFFFPILWEPLWVPGHRFFSLLRTLHGPVYRLPIVLGLGLLSLKSSLALHRATSEEVMCEQSHGERLGVSVWPASAILTALGTPLLSSAHHLY